MRRNLLFLSPTLPDATGQGSAMRAGMNLSVLTSYFSVWLLAVEIYRRGQLLKRGIPALNWPVRGFKHCMPESCPGGVDVARVFPGVTFDHVHVFRAVMIRHALPYLSSVIRPRPFCVLDLDDFESKTTLRFADLKRRMGRSEAAGAELRRATDLAAVERQFLPRFDTVCACSEADATELSAEYACRTIVVPNAVRLPGPPIPLQPARAEFTVLFVGTMNYFPNEDGVLFFVRELLPHIQRKIGVPVRLVVAGPVPTPAVCRLREMDGVAVTGWVDDLAPLYAQADAVIAPLRAGGGTRIKILEAFSFHRPVISTRLGAEGLGLSDRTEILFAETPQEWADACHVLRQDPEFAVGLADRAYACAKGRYNIDAVAKPLLAAHATTLLSSCNEQECPAT